MTATITKTSTKTTKTTKTAKAAPAEAKLTLREATVKLLGTAKGKQGLTAREIIELLAAKGWWTPATGKTPVPTLLCLLHSNKAKGETFRRTKSKDRGVLWSLRATAAK